MEGVSEESCKRLEESYKRAKGRLARHEVTLV